MIDPDLQEIIDNVANIGMHVNDFPEPRTEKEQYLINYINDLCMWIVDIIEDMDDDEEEA